MEESDALMALNLLEGIGPVTVRRLLESFGSAASSLGAPIDRLKQVRGVGPEMAEKLHGWKSRVDVAAEAERVRRFGCQVVTAVDEVYPARLRDLYDPPICLYYRGNLDCLRSTCVALVGSRQTTAYGMSVARKLGYQLAQLGVTVVSGGARGIDTAAHEGALAGGGQTAVVLGHGIDRVFPAENVGLFKRAAEQGIVLTQFPFNRKAGRQTFPVRNRIVAGISLGTVVIEANLTSGALITANMAADIGRQVFAVPGRVDSPRSKGCHQLLRNGAALCESVEDIRNEFESLFPSGQDVGDQSEEKIGTEPEMDDEMAQVWRVLTLEEKHQDLIAAETGLPASKVSTSLLRLELQRVIIQSPGKLFRRAQ